MKRYTIHGVAASQGKELENQPYTACEDPEGLWIKREDVEKEIKEVYEVAYFTGQNSNLNSCDGYMRSKHTVTAMAVSLHQVFDRAVATLRFKTKDGEPIIIDVDHNIFEKFIRTHLIGQKCNCEEMYDQRAYWFCPVHGYKRR